jgi:hypothetical protein
MNYKVQEHLEPKALTGISDDQIAQHWALYEGYVKNANRLLEATAGAEAGSPAWAEQRRRLSLEMDGLVLHEYDFGNLASGSKLSPGSAGGLFNCWISSHEQGHRAGFHPVLVLQPGSRRAARPGHQGRALHRPLPREAS